MVDIVKYKLDNGKIPDYISDGGYFPDGDYLIGIADNLDEETKAKLTILTKDELETHIKRQPMTEVVTRELTDADKIALNEKFCTEKKVTVATKL